MIESVAENKHESTTSHDKPVVGLLWGAFPWEECSRKVGQLLSMGAVGRTTTRALQTVGRVVPFVAPAPKESAETRRASLEDFLRGIDVLFADVYAGTGPALELRHELGLHCPAVLFAGGAMPKGADAMLFPWQHLLRVGDGLWFTSQADREIWRRLVRWSSLHEWVVPLAVDETLFRPRARSEQVAARARHGLPISAPLLVAVGRLNIQKNLHSLLHLLGAVRRHVPDAHLCFVGEGDDTGLHEFGVLNTGYVEWLRGQVTALGLAQAVTFLGLQFGEALAQINAAADVLVSASLYHRENFGLAPAEAQACGVPVVCSAWNGFKDVVRDGETGFLMDTVLTRHGVRVDWATGADRVVALLSNPERRATMGSAAATWARERFSIDALAQALGTVIGEAGSAPADTRHTTGGSHHQLAFDRTSAYEPSGFARRYEAHKRACGWYGDTPEARQAGAPRMFQGRDDQLYVHLMQPFTSRVAMRLTHGEMEPQWVPYFPSPVELDPVRQVVEDCDPIWPHRRFCRPLEWAVLQRIDGVTPVESIASTVTEELPDANRDSVIATLRQLHREGFLLFRQLERLTIAAEQD
ncbi:MAG TPA: glycosyltransferase family 4 protein [Chloroflexota bacterium]|nr:glycosyltransferase family 4 protein [Chloroflexota bacterium]